MVGGGYGAQSGEYVSVTGTASVSGTSRSDLAKDLGSQRSAEIAEAAVEVLLARAEQFVHDLQARSVPLWSVDSGGRESSEDGAQRGIFREPICRVLRVEVERVKFCAGVVRPAGSHAPAWHVFVEGPGGSTSRPVPPAMSALLESDHLRLRASLLGVPGQAVAFTRGAISSPRSLGSRISSLLTWILEKFSQLMQGQALSRSIRPDVEGEIAARIAEIDRSRTVCMRCGARA
jgi:hypothetical protein